jgi:hypothetical protein
MLRTSMPMVCDVSYKRLNKYLVETAERKGELGLLDNERR